MLLGAIFGLLLSAITLDGVTGDGLSADAFFDANNVRLGDPMLLTIDFFGNADLESLHPPKLAAAVNPRVWKVDDASAKTVTGRGIRRLTYRVRPVREGLQTFPSLEFAYALTGTNVDGRCATQPMPVHVKPGQQAALSGVEADDFAHRVRPDGIVIRVATPLDEDTAFAWRKACARPTAEAFAPFDFPEARLNEAACDTLSGNWAKALKIYERLEWRIGQTPEIERGIVAALDAKSEGATKTLPAWRVILRPVLRYAALGRVLVILATIAVFVAVILLCRRCIRALVCFAILLTAVPALGAGTPSSPQGIFEEMHRMMEQQMREMRQAMNGSGVQINFSGGNGTQRTVINNRNVEPFAGTLTLRASKAEACVAEPFDLLLDFEHTKGYTIENLQFGLSETFCLQTDSKVERLAPGKAHNPSNVVDRFSVRVHYIAPLKLDLSATVSGFARTGSGFFSFGQSFALRSPALALSIRPLPTEHQPADFAGAVGSDFRVRQSVDRTFVETNDVVTVTRTVTYAGVLPRAAEWSCIDETEGRTTWRDYFVADGRTNVPPFKVTYYDVAAKGYRTAEAKAIPLAYGSARGETAVAAVVVDAAPDDGKGTSVRSRKLRFYPSETAPVIGETTGRPRVTEERPLWVRVDDGQRAGWIRKEELP